MTTLLFTIAVSAHYRGTQEIYSAQVVACNGENLYHLAEGFSISEALEKVVQEMRLQEKDRTSFHQENWGRVIRSILPCRVLR